MAVDTGAGNLGQFALDALRDPGARTGTLAFQRVRDRRRPRQSRGVPSRKPQHLESYAIRSSGPERWDQHEPWLEQLRRYYLSMGSESVPKSPEVDLLRIGQKRRRTGGLA